MNGGYFFFPNIIIKVPISLDDGHICLRKRFKLVRLSGRWTIRFSREVQTGAVHRICVVHKIRVSLGFWPPENSIAVDVAPVQR